MSIVDWLNLNHAINSPEDAMNLVSISKYWSKDGTNKEGKTTELDLIRLYLIGKYKYEPNRCNIKYLLE